MTFQLSSVNLNSLNGLPFCTNNLNCYLSHSRDAILDMVGFTLEEIIDGNGLMVSVIPDTSKPSLVQFDEFNFANNSILFTIDETVNANSINTSAIILQCLFENPISLVQLIYPGIAYIMNSTSVLLKLDERDVDRIKLDKFVCNYRGDCYLKLLSYFIEDVYGNLINEVISILYLHFHI